MDLDHADGLPPPPYACAQCDGGSLMRAQDVLPHDYKQEDFAVYRSSSRTVSSPIGSSSQSVFSSPVSSVTRSDDCLRPVRPKSTPFLFPEQRSSSVCCNRGSRDHDVAGGRTPTPVSLIADLPLRKREPSAGLARCPIEVHEAILDHIFGYRVSATSRSGMRTACPTRSLGTAMRHSRRKEYTQLSLVSRTWRVLIQQRLYRHVKLKATVVELEEAMMHFATSPYLQHYVRHIEIWFPVFKPAYGNLSSSRSLPLPMVTQEGGLTNATYVLPEDNCTLEEAFTFVNEVLPAASVITLEGGDRRKSPQVAYFRHTTEASRLPAITSVRTLITRGQWNLVRNDSDYGTLMAALPGLTDWQGAFSKPKSKSYITAAHYLQKLPASLRHFDMCLESDYRREAGMPHFYFKALQSSHICSTLAAGLSILETFSYTGRICRCFFDAAVRKAQGHASRLTSIDLTVKNCCRHPSMFHESGSGVQDMGFIEAFEELVLGAVRSLKKFSNLTYLRIRFVDLESVLPALNPYFLLRDGICTGVWSERIIEEMAQARPSIKYSELSESFGDIFYNKDGRMVVAPENPQPRVTSLKLSNYRSLTATRITIQ